MGLEVRDMDTGQNRLWKKVQAESTGLGEVIPNLVWKQYSGIFLESMKGIQMRSPNNKRYGALIVYLFSPGKVSSGGNQLPSIELFS